MNPNQQDISVKCFVINLESDWQRRDDISRQLNALGLPYEIFSAVDGRMLSEDELTKVYDKARAIQESHDLTRGELGCALSHVGVYRQIVRDNISHALVLEDDALLSDEVPEILSRLTRMFPKEQSQVVMLNYVEKYKRWNMVPVGEEHYVINTYGGNKNAHGYFITLAGARNLSENLFPVWLVADRWERFKEKGFIKLKALLPYCIGLTEQATQSNLENDRVERMQLYPRSGLRYFIHRYIYKKFIYQIFMRPFLRIATQKETW